MGRHKTISDADVLAIARTVFREKGHTATTREIAEAAGISEPILYQRFASKDDLFFAAMRPTGPDIDQLLGPLHPPADARRYLRRTIARIGRHFAEVIPLALRLMTHPSFDKSALQRTEPRGSDALEDALAKRLTSLARRQRIAMRSTSTTARLLLSLAHDWALGSAFAPGKANHTRELLRMVDVVWSGLRPDRS